MNRKTMVWITLFLAYTLVITLFFGHYQSPIRWDWKFDIFTEKYYTRLIKPSSYNELTEPVYINDYTTTQLHFTGILGLVFSLLTILFLASVCTSATIEFVIWVFGKRKQKG